MRWGSRKLQDIDYRPIIAMIAVIMIALFILALFARPRQTSADDWVNLRVATRTSMRVAQEPAIDVSVITAKSKVIPVPPVKTVSRSEPPVKIIYCEITAYSPTVAECDASPLATASGKRVYVGGIAADLSILPFGSRVLIPDYNGGKPCTVIDTGRAIRGNKLDVFFWNPQDSVNWGRRRNVRVTVLYIPRR